MTQGEHMEIKYPNKLHAIRKQRGWTWKEMSQKIFGKMSNHIYETADGKRLVSMETLPTIEDVTGMSWREIWADWLEKREKVGECDTSGFDSLMRGLNQVSELQASLRKKEIDNQPNSV
jgi:transcriptional regulator with XRE-family HTH domain